MPCVSVVQTINLNPLSRFMAHCQNGNIFSCLHHLLLDRYFIRKFNFQSLSLSFALAHFNVSSTDLEIWWIKSYVVVQMKMSSSNKVCVFIYTQLFSPTTFYALLVGLFVVVVPVFVLYQCFFLQLFVCLWYFDFILQIIVDSI